MSVDLSTQVTIVGGGPVGLGLAIELGRRGIEVVVLEKESNVHRIPKGQNLTQRTLEHFRLWGVEDQIRQARVMPPGFPAAGVNAWDHLLGPLAHPWFRRSQVGAYYFAANERLPQYLTEEVLRSRADELESVTTLYGEPAVSVVSDTERVTVGTDRRTVRSEWVVGADGSRSMVRAAIGVTEEIRDHDRRMALLVFRSPQLARVLTERFGDAAFFNVLHPDLAGYWRFLGVVEVGESWFFHAPVDDGVTAETLDYQALLHSTVGTEFEVDLEYLGFWDLRVAIANDYRSDRGFVAGDAAHSHPPYGGYGINTGFEDARNLGWKLAATLEGWGGAGLLDTYSLERRSVFESTATHFIEGFINRDRDFIAATRGMTESEFEVAWEDRRAGSRFGVSDFAPHYEGSPIVHGPPGSTISAVGEHEMVARPGRHLPPLETAPDLFDRLGDRLTLITEGPSGFSFPNVSTIHVDDISQYGADLVLVRPDHYVAWTGEMLDQAMVDRALGWH